MLNRLVDTLMKIGRNLFSTALEMALASGRPRFRLGCLEYYGRCSESVLSISEVGGSFDSRYLDITSAVGIFAGHDVI